MPSQYLTHCQMNPWEQRSKWNLNKKTRLFIRGNVFENIVYKICHFILASVCWWRWKDMEVPDITQCCYNAVFFFQNHHERHPIAPLLGWYIGCPLCVQSLIYSLPQSPHWCVQYCVMKDSVIMACGCILRSVSVLIKAVICHMVSQGNRSKSIVIWKFL